MERNHKYLYTVGGLALTFAALSGCGKDSSGTRISTLTPLAGCQNQVLDSEQTKSGENIESPTEKRFDEVINFMECSTIESVKKSAVKLKELHSDGYIAFENDSVPGDAVKVVAYTDFVGGFPDPDHSSYRMFVDFYQVDMSNADLAIYLHNEAIKLNTFNALSKDNQISATKIASVDEIMGYTKCVAWVKTIEDIALPLQAYVKDAKIKSYIETYKEQGVQALAECLQKSNLN